MGDAQVETFSVSNESNKEHAIGVPDCAECWSGYPRLCKCGGLIHADFGDYVGDGYYLDTECDKCGGRQNDEALVRTERARA
jgi:hypothetical protein